MRSVHVSARSWSCAEAFVAWHEGHGTPRPARWHSNDAVPDDGRSLETGTVLLRAADVHVPASQGGSVLPPRPQHARPQIALRSTWPCRPRTSGREAERRVAIG